MYVCMYILTVGLLIWLGLRPGKLQVNAVGKTCIISL